MNLEINQVYTFKLSSGEELVAKVIETTDKVCVVEHPVSVAPGPQGMGLMPSMFTADPSAKITLNTNAVTIFALTDDAVKVKYLEATTGITVPSKKLILG